MPKIPNKFSNLSELGFSVFPVLYGDKKPALPWKAFQTSRASAEDIDLWDAGEFNVGIACGRISNLLVVDVDSSEAQALYDTFDAPCTPTVKTARGRHYYFQMPAGELRNRAHIGSVALDVRGEGGYVVGPGSRHPDGAIYEWEVSPHDCPLASLPANLTKLLSKSNTEPARNEGTALALRPAANGNRFSAWIGEALEQGLLQISQAQSGERNDTLNRVSFVIATEVAAAKLDWLPFAEKLLHAARNIGLPEDEARGTIASAWAGGLQKPCQWIETAQRYVYLSARGQFYNLAARQGITESAFNRTHNSERQWEKGAIATFLTDRDFTEKAFDLRFDPMRTAGVYTHDGERWLNTYVDPAIEPIDGDATPFADFVEHLIPNQSERDHLLKMIAWTVRNPGKKLGHALLLRTEQQGVGKSMLIGIWRELLGTKNTRLTTTEEITGNFQSFIEGNLLVLVEELNVAFGMQGYNRIKNLITGDTAEINEKFVSSRERPNHASFVFLTNLSEPILIEDSDRRFFFIDSPAVPREPEFYAKFATWWKESLGIIRAYIDAIDLTTFNPFAPPPETAAKRALQLASRSPLEQEIAEAITERRFPFSRDVICLKEIVANVPAARTVPLQRLKGAVRSLGGMPLGSHRTNGEWFEVGSRPTFVRGAALKQSLWAIANSQYWLMASPQSRIEEFARSEGILVPFDDTGIDIRHASDHGGIFKELATSQPVQEGDEAGDLRSRVLSLLSTSTS
ncbi:bifunctional DNA primase/polymerase [Sphingomonas sp.]|uniref:bifunctional DNA primase/polymerase n=1 Tax=Sphingomonas sp. TaxID=28214 RepID=UPI00289CDFF6|nr:bifunctional DNA primase/polymerase [Sphingomonas sp.]